MYTRSGCLRLGCSRIDQAFSQTGSRSEQIEHVSIVILNRVYLKVLQRHCIDNTFVNACLFLSSNWNITMIYNWLYIYIFIFIYTYIKYICWMKHIFVTGRIPTFCKHTPWQPHPKRRSTEGSCEGSIPISQQLGFEANRVLEKCHFFRCKCSAVVFHLLFYLYNRNMHANIIFSCITLEHTQSHAYQFTHCFNLIYLCMCLYIPDFCEWIKTHYMQRSICTVLSTHH